MTVSTDAPATVIAWSPASRPLRTAALSASGAAVIAIPTVLPLSAAGLVSAPLAAVTYGRTPMRWSLPPRLGAIGIGLWLCTGVETGSGWSHFVPGMTVGGLGLGAVMAITAQGSLDSVESRRAGMATGAVNSARQIGIAVGIAALGALLNSRAGTRTEQLLAQEPLTRGMAPERRSALVDALGSGAGLRVLDFLPEQLSFAKPMLARIASTVSAYGIDSILLAATAATLATAVLVTVLLHFDKRYR